MKLSVLDSSARVFGRGWIAVDSFGRRYLVMTPGAQVSSGVSLSGAPNTLDPASRYDIEGSFQNGVLTVSSATSARDQSRPNLRPDHVQGGPGRPLTEWKLIMDGLIGTPLDTAAIGGWTVRSEGGDQSAQQIVQVVIPVKWITEDLANWCAKRDDLTEIQILPLITNAKHALTA